MNQYILDYYTDVRDLLEHQEIKLSEVVNISYRYVLKAQKIIPNETLHNQCAYAYKLLKNDLVEGVDLLDGMI